LFSSWHEKRKKTSRLLPLVHERLSKAVDGRQLRAYTKGEEELLMAADDAAPSYKRAGDSSS
jgi:hypothetical protein